MDPDDLRRLLWETAAASDEPALEAFCRTHRAAIVQHFPAWRTMPPDVRVQPTLAEAYVQTMAAIARLFDQRLGDPSLLQALIGQPENNPLIQWQQKLDQAQKAMNELRYAETIDLLNDVLIDTRSLKGSGLNAYLPVTYGLLGECYFQSGQPAKAVSPTDKALDLSERTGDAEGIRAYLGNLYEIHRYLGDADRAAHAAAELAERLEEQGEPGEAERYRKQAALIRRGEPLNRVVVSVDGRRLELDEVVSGVEGQVQFVFERNRLTLRPASELTKQGEKKASQGRFQAALDLFHQAAEADRYDPHCHYQAGLTLLYLQRYAEGAKAYETTEKLAPGWFQCRSGAWLARQLQQGKLTHEVFQLWHVLEDGPLNPQQKVALTEKALTQAPHLALLHAQHGKALRALGQGFAADAAFRRGLACAEEPDIKTRLLVELGSTVNNEDEKKRLLQEAVVLNGNLVAAATARLVLAFE